MELKVWVEGIQRIVCGVTEVTTCQDVVFALAHATGKTGRFTLIERWRNNERLLAPHENPLKILMKWGEYSSDVQFILQRSDQQQQQKKDAQQQQQQQHQTPPTTQTPTQSQQQLLRQQQKLNQLNNNHIGATNGVVTNGKHSGPTSPTSPTSGNNNGSSLIPNGVLSTHNHINSNNNISSHHYAHHPSNGDEQQQQQHAKSKLHQNNLKNSANNQLHQHAQHHHQQAHHHQHQLSSSSTSSDQQQRSHQQSNGVGALIRTGNDPSNGSVGPGVAAAVKQSELIISSSNGSSSTAGALERGKETRKSLNSSGSSGKTEQHHHHHVQQQLQHHQQSQKHQAQTNQQNQNVGIVRGIVQHQQKFSHVQRHSPSSTTVTLAKGGVSTTVSSDHSSSSNSSTSSSVSSTASSSSNASSNNTSTSSGIGGSGGSGASGTSGHHQSHSTQQQQQPTGKTTPVEATYASVIKKPKSHATAQASTNASTATAGGNNVVGEFNAADLRSSLDRKVNGLVFSNGLNERVTQPPSTSPSGGMAGPQQSPGTSVIVGATLKPEHQLLHHHHHGTIGRHYHHTQLQNLLCADNQQHLDTSSVSSISSSSVGGGNNSSNHVSLLNGSSSTTNSPITGISSNGALVPPPYRDPPPPRNSPLSHTLTSLSSTGSGTGSSTQGRRQEKDGSNHTGGGGSSSASSTVSSLVVVGPSGPEEILVGSSVSDSIPHVTGYRELMQLIKLQREKINTQQADLSKYDTEIVYLENRSREQTDQLDAIAQEISKTEQQYRQAGDQLQAYQYVEEESELVRQQEKTLKSEITLLRSKLANCETELLQCKNKIRLLMDEILVEQRKYSRQLQVEIDLAVQSADQANKAHEKLKGEVTLLEGAIADKKKQVEKLVHEMKEVNLQSLAVVPPADEVRHLLEGESEFGSVKPGSTRRMIGSPRQLENAVPTSKNPHGVWV
ncbi:myb-like protein AA isoform X3 [Anopheles funestus]|uniref:myb-like protein AA isoform X3 n=1 Tax=Anopheles funestus TaxID=62324 RepID=UPI0020C646E0|nr:myb-like protein AA isoform X3 [Anopheles funestus]